MYIISEINQKSIWDEFFNENGSPSFLQSWEWGDVQKSLGYDILRVGIYKDQNLKVISQIIKIKSRRGNFLFVPHGPIFEVKSSLPRRQAGKLKVQSLIKELLKYLVVIAKNEGFSFIRIAPVQENILENLKIFSSLGFKKAPIYMHAERLWVLNLTSEVEEADVASAGKTSEVLYKTDEQLLIQMRKTTRYLIRKAQRDGVVIEKRTDDKAVEEFWTIYEETARRENFVPFSKEFIREEFESFNKTGNAAFLFGKVNKNVILKSFQDLQSKNQMPKSIQQAQDPEYIEGQVRHDKEVYLASALIVFTKSTAFYHQGASIHTKIPVTYLLQWEAIKEAKKRGCKYYNFWGILQEGRSPKNWQGLTLFKTGFGGHQIDYLPTQDFVISRRYYLTYLYEKFLAWRRGV